MADINMNRAINYTKPNNEWLNNKEYLLIRIDVIINYCQI